MKSFVRLFLAISLFWTLVGCPKDEPIIVHNFTGVDIYISSSSDNVKVAAGKAVMLPRDFSFDRDDSRAEIMRYRGSKVGCYQLVFGPIGAKDSDFIRDGRREVHIALLPRGAYFVPARASLSSLDEAENLLPLGTCLLRRAD